MSLTFSNFSPRSFEQLIQSICLKVFGPGVRVYGDGPDAGREASIEGEVPYPNALSPWRGYTLIQVKYRLKPTGDARDADWLVAQLEAEAKKFADPERKLRRPDNYLLVSNVTLSSIESQKHDDNNTRRSKGKPRKGGQQKIDEVAKKLKGILWKDNFDWMHADKIERILEGNEDIRRKYSAWLTSGDVIADIISWINFQRKDFDRVITQYLQRCLYEDRWVNLRQAGYQDDNQTGLANVFIDLPYTMTGEPISAEVSEEAAPVRAETQKPLLVSSFIERFKDKFDHHNIASSPGTPLPNRFVVIGGPGQGKSTLSQYLAQLHRAALLRHRGKWITPDNIPIIDELTKQCECDGTEMPAARRFPVRLDLPHFADAIDKMVKQGNPAPSLIEHIGTHIRTKTQQDIGLDDLRTWLNQYPWLVILDGLDEVPPSGNRDPVINAIREFWDEVTSAGSDLALVVTTRRQGFNDELSPSYYNHIELTHLSPEQAIKYATRLLEHRVPNEDERTATLKRLREASNEAVTARLMVSPLQVTIMAALVQAKGDLPQDRWGLFDGYYSVVRNREQNKPEPVSKYLRKYGKDIEFIHHYAGLTLQIDSERKGGADATMSITQLRRMVMTRLLTEEHNSNDANNISDGIVGEAMTRLILLTSNNGKDVGFEIRSLQEFMASAALMSGTDAEKQKRLTYIAGKSHWRHVFLFAAGRCFAEVSSEHLRASVYQICEELDSTGEDKVYRSIRAGGKLALDLIEDAAAAGQPRPFRHLARRALNLLDVEGSGYASRLAKAYDDCASSQYSEAIEPRLLETNRFEAWRLAFDLRARGVTWIDDNINKNLNKSKQNIPEILKSIEITRSHYHNDILTKAICHASFVECMTLTWDFRGEKLDHSRELTLFATLHGHGTLRREISALHDTGAKALRVRVSGASEAEGSLYSEIASFRTDWPAFKIAAEFCANANITTLALALRQLADLLEDPYHAKNIQSQWRYLPWQFGIASAETAEPQKLRAFADKVESGILGDDAEWTAAEARWSTKGITFDDLIATGADERFPNATKGAPIFQVYSITVGQDAAIVAKHLLVAATKAKPGPFRDNLQETAFFCLSAADDSDLANEIVPLLQNALADNKTLLIGSLPWLQTDDWNDPDFVELVSQMALSDELLVFNDMPRIYERVKNATLANPDKFGLLIVLAMAGSPRGNEIDVINLVKPLLTQQKDRPKRFDLAIAILYARNGLIHEIDIMSVAGAIKEFTNTRILNSWLQPLTEALEARISEESVLGVGVAMIEAGLHHQSIFRMLSRAADLRKTEFQDEKVWAALNLSPAFHQFVIPLSTAESTVLCTTPV